MPNDSIRVRFAPSPTGLLHVGNARTALYNWLFARHGGGKFVLRVEDTDVERSEARYEAQLIEDLRWLGLGWDEGPGAAGDSDGPHGPYRQSERLEIYRAHTQRLLAEGRAYRCFCTAEELEAERERAIRDQRPQVYSGRCRGLSAAECDGRAAAGEAYAVRLRAPERPVRFHDLLRGELEFAPEAVGDFIVQRSSGMPVYNYVVVIDDGLMEITHVIRGDDHISNTPRQVAIYEAFGWRPPEFAHLSTILGSDRERLSKRHGATSISHFREMGYLPEALVNYLALLGWGAEGGTRETFTLAELVKEFKLERVTTSPAVFDFAKLDWLNRHYLKLRALEEVSELAWPYFERRGWMPALSAASTEVRGWFTRLVGVFLPGVDRLEQLPERAEFVFAVKAESAAAEASAEGEKAPAVVGEFASRVRAEAAPLTGERFKALMNEVKAATGAKGKELFHPVRVVLTGAQAGPEFDKLIPLLEEGSRLELPVHVKSLRERVMRVGCHTGQGESGEATKAE